MFSHQHGYGQLSQSPGPGGPGHAGSKLKHGFGIQQAVKPGRRFPQKGVQLFKVDTDRTIEKGDIIRIILIGEKREIHGDLYNLVPEVTDSSHIFTVTQAVAAIKTIS
jgi:ribosomal protein L15